MMSEVIKDYVYCYDYIHTYCRWCGSLMRTEKVKRRKFASWDKGDGNLKSKYDYHDTCWDEAIEVVI